MRVWRAIFFFITFMRIAVTRQQSIIEDIIKQWAPLVWLAPGEKYLPLSVEDFLNNIYPSKNGHVSFKNPSLKRPTVLPIGKESESYYLVANLDDLNNKSSFVYGNNPSKYPVPLYVIIKKCPRHLSFRSSNANTISDNIQVLMGNSNSDLHFTASYWMFFPFNEGKDICFIGKVPTPFLFNTCLGKKRTLGNHIGDWEHFSLLFNGQTYPEELFSSVHDAGVYYRFDPKRGLFKYKKQETRKGIVQKPKFPPTVRFFQGHPVLFAAYGSHGLWSAPGEHYFVRVPKLYDKNGFGAPWKTWNDLKMYYTDNPPAWMQYRGKWGNPKSKCVLFKKLGVCEYTDGPRGILRRKEDFIC